MNSMQSNGLGWLSAALLGSWNGTTDVGQHTSLSNSSIVQQFVEFLVISDGQKNVSRDNSGLLVVLGGVSCQLQDLSSQVFEDCSEIDGCTSSDSFGVVGVSEESANSADGELKASSGWFGDCLGWSGFSFSAFSSFSCHVGFQMFISWLESAQIFNQLNPLSLLLSNQN